MPKVVVCTCAYNAEKTMGRTIESILAQTHDNWVYYCLDNGSTDNTGAIIRDYAARDSRIIALANKVNHVWEPGNSWKDVTKYNDDKDLLCFLDADDEYTPDFLKKMFTFIHDNNLDIAACGFYNIVAQTNQLYDTTKLTHNLIITDRADFSLHFPAYHQLMRTLWGKVYSLSLLRKCKLKNNSKIGYGKDTLFTMEAFRNALRVGIFAESLHKYYASPKSHSYQWDEKRIISDRILDDTARSFLLDKCGVVTPQNDRLLHRIYLNAIIRTIDIMTDLTPDVKLRNLRDIFTHEQTLTLFRKGYESDNDLDESLRIPVTNWLLYHREAITLDNADVTAEILTAMYDHLAQLLRPEDLSYVICKIPVLIELLIKKDYTQFLKSIRAWIKHYKNDDLVLTRLEIAVSKAAGKPDDE